MSRLRMVGLGVLAAGMASWTVPTRSALAEDTSPRLIHVAADATVTVAPDHAQIDLGVVTQSKSASEAASENAKRVDRVLGAVRGVLGAKADLKTVDYSVNPTYGESKANQPPTINGYSAQNIVRVGMDDLTQVSKVIVAAMAGSANDVR